MDQYFSFIPYFGQVVAGSLLTGANPAFGTSGGVFAGGDPGAGGASSTTGSPHGWESRSYVLDRHQTMNTMFLMMVLPMLSAIVRGSVQWSYQKALAILNDRYNVSILIKEDQDIYYNVNQYVTKKQEETQLMTMRHVEAAQEVPDTNDHYHDDTALCPKFTITPLSGTVVVWHNQHKIWVEREDGSNNMTKLESSTTLSDFSKLFSKPSNVLKVSMRGTDVRVLKGIVQEWVDQIYYENIRKLNVYQCTREYGMYIWHRISNKEMRSFDSVVLKKGQREEILQDVQRFLNAREKYELRGIPYRHAVILYGPPGTGKTSCIKGLAQALKKNIAHISLAVSMNDEQFLSTLSDVPTDSIVVIEDFDRSHLGTKSDSDPSPKDNNGTSMDRITEAGLLNALDGINTPDGTLFFLTCNDINKIGDAIKRPGRIDQIYLISYADEYQIEEMFWRFFGEGDATINPKVRHTDEGLQTTARHFVSHIQKLSSEVTTAMLQKFFLEFEKDNEAADGTVNKHLLRDFDFVSQLYEKIMVKSIEEMLLKKKAEGEAKKKNDVDQSSDEVKAEDDDKKEKENTTTKIEEGEKSSEGAAEPNGHIKEEKNGC